MRSLLILFAFFAVSSPGGEDPPNPFVAAYIQAARDHLAAGETDLARSKVERALERDHRHLGALRLLAEIAEQSEDQDAAVHSLHRWLEAYDRLDKPPVKAKIRREVAAHLLTLDPDAGSWDELQNSYIKNLLDLGKDYQKRKSWLGALEVYQQLLLIDPGNRRALTAITSIRRKGGEQVAIEDIYAGGGDPNLGKSAEQIARSDAMHDTWQTAYKDKSENYTYKTDAGYTVLKTARIAMEQMNRFYRRFFHFKEKGGKTPNIEIRIFKNRDEYLELGASPAEWSGGHFIGSAVETYVGGVTGRESIRSMYRTLFHEASHQFKALISPPAPPWLNEGFASFFEGCVIMSNGTVKWNQVPPGRLLPLARRLEAGFMQEHEEAREEHEAWITPTTAPDLSMVVANEYTWGPPWYAPTWGVVYFLHNYRDQQGQAVYREALDEYFKSFKAGLPADPIEHFEEYILNGSKLSPVATIDELTPIWREWILALRDTEVGRTKNSSQLLSFARAAEERDDHEAALAFLEEAREDRPQDVEILWSMATLLEKMKRKPRAAATYRDFSRTMELDAKTEDQRYQQAREKILELDPFAKRYLNINNRLSEQGLELARRYESLELPRMALEILRRMSSRFSLPEALDYYAELAERVGLSLANWRVAYNETNLQGWASFGDDYQAYGAMIRVEFDPDEGVELTTRQLICDVPFNSDFSLEAEMRIDGSSADGFQGTLMGLCFGLKGAQNFRAVVLHPKGFMDISTNRGGVWEVHDHRTAQVGSEWKKLRIDVTGNTADFYLDGKYVRPITFASEASVRGSFGLISGNGRTYYRNIRILERSPFDPSARIERKLALAKLAADSSLRQAGNFTGMAPPELDVERFVQGETVQLSELLGKPVMLVFWSPRQDKIIPTTEYLTHLIERGKQAGLVTVVVCEGSTNSVSLLEYLGEHLMADAHIAIDRASAPTYDTYFVKAGFHGLPRFLLLDREGNVIFEGDPGLRAGVGWEPDQPPTFVDAAFDRLISKLGGKSVHDGQKDRHATRDSERQRSRN